MQPYEELIGGRARDIYFRAERYQVKEVLGRVPPRICIGQHDYPVYDLSIGGVGFYAKTIDEVGQVGERPAVDLTIGDKKFYQGRGEISRFQKTPRGVKVGLTITEGYLDVPRMVAVHDEMAVREQLDEAPILHGLHVAKEYRKLCADAVYMLRRYRNMLDQYERQVTQDGPEGRSRLEEICKLCEERFRPEWRAIWREGNEIVTPMLNDLLAVKATKHFTEAVLTPELMDGPIWRQSYEKPLGYAGDYEVLTYVYSGELEGDTAYARLCHRIGLDVGGCVGTRMEMICDAIAEVVRESPGEGPCDITSLACGPAEEVVRYLSRNLPPRPVRFTLIDQDHAALARAYESAYPHVSRLGGLATVRCLHLSFGQLFGRSDVFKDIPSQPLIYTAGLVDYLPKQQAQLVVAGLYQKLAPGGLLIVGNMKAATDNVWPLKFILDWELTYRTKEEVYELGAGLDAASMELRTDPSGYSYLLYLRHP